MKKNEVKLKKLERKLSKETDDLEREHLEIKINEMEAQAASSRGYVEGAVRKLNFFSNQYENLMKKIGKEELTEEDYEREEVKYHIMTCMKQALNAARSRGGNIDEGNLIYVFDLGHQRSTGASGSVFIPSMGKRANQARQGTRASPHSSVVRGLCREMGALS